MKAVTIHSGRVITARTESGATVATVRKTCNPGASLGFPPFPFPGPPTDPGRREREAIRLT